MQYYQVPWKKQTNVTNDKNGAQFFFSSSFFFKTKNTQQEKICPMNAFPMMSRVPVPLSSSGGTSGPLTQDPSCGPVVQFVGCRVCGGVGWGKGGWLWSVILRGSSDVTHTHTHTQSINLGFVQGRKNGGVGGLGILPEIQDWIISLTRPIHTAS